MAWHDVLAARDNVGVCHDLTTLQVALRIGRLAHLA
jgi:hypothetical protein